MSVNILDIEACIRGYVYTWNVKASFYTFKHSERNKEGYSTSCFTMSDMTSWSKAMEAIVSHYEEEEKKRRIPRI